MRTRIAERGTVFLLLVLFSASSSVAQPPANASEVIVVHGDTEYVHDPSIIFDH